MPDPSTDPVPDPDPDPEPTGNDALKKALEAERRARRDAEKAAAALRNQIKEREDAEKTDAQKAAEALADAQKAAAAAELRALRLEVASEKGLNAAQARRLVGTSREELEADADEIASLFPVSKGVPAAQKQPTPAHDGTGGLDPSEPPVELDPRKLAERIPRL